MKFERVWLSTDAQLTALIETYENASRLTKLVGRFNFPCNTTHIRGVISPWMRIPTAFVVEGELTISEQVIAFSPRHYLLFGWRLVGAQADLSFEFLASDIIAVEPAEFSSPVAQMFDLPFTRMSTNHIAPLDNFLICVGGRLSMRKIRKRSRDLRRNLQEVINQV